MPEATVATALRQVPLFAGLPGGQLAWIAERVAEVRLPAGARIATEGDPADGLYVVLDGQTEWTKRAGRQEAHVVTLGVASSPAGTRATSARNPRRATRVSRYGCPPTSPARRGRG